MPPKEGKKALQKKKDKLIEDKTFGLKNKNKSKKVQQHVQSVTKSVLSSGDPKVRKAEEQRRQMKVESKMRKKAAEEERNALFGEALLAVQKKTSTNLKKGVGDAKGRDFDDGGEGKSGTSKAMKMMYQMDAKEMEDALTSDPNYVKTIEDEIEIQRQKMLAELRDKGIKGTPVTPVTFAHWQEKKKQARLEAAKKMVEAELRKKKGGKGLSILSGRDLFEYKRELFKDDEDVMDLIRTGDDEDDDSTRGDLAVIAEEVAEKVQMDLFLDGDDIDLDEIDDD